MSPENLNTFAKFTIEEWCEWILGAVRRQAIYPRLILGRDEDVQHGIQDVYSALPSEDLRDAMKGGLSYALTSTPILPRDEPTCIQFHYLFRIAAALKPPGARKFLRGLLKTEVFAGSHAAGTDLHCLLVGLCAKYGVDSQLIRDLHAAISRIRSLDYPLACLRSVALGSEDGEEACRFLEYLVPALGDGALAAKVEAALDLCMRLHGLEAIAKWYQRHENAMGTRHPKELALFEARLNRLLSKARTSDIELAPALPKVLFQKYGAEALLTFVTGHRREHKACVDTLVRLKEVGLDWKLDDPYSLVLWERGFQPDARIILSLGGGPPVPLEISVHEREYLILSEAMQALDFTAAAHELYKNNYPATYVQ